MDVLGGHVTNIGKLRTQKRIGLFDSTANLPAINNSHLLDDLENGTLSSGRLKDVKIAC